MSCTKQGQIHNWWIQLIIAVIVIIVFLFFFRIIKEGADSSVAGKTCEQSIEANTRGHIRGLAIDSEIKCPANLEPITAKKEEEKKREIATRMAQCWVKFKEGRAELFFENKIYCSICDVFEFEDKEPVKGFQSYLAETKMQGKEITYADYFSGYKTAEAGKALPKLTIEQASLAKTQELDTGKRYSVIFVYAKGKDEIGKAARHISGQTPEGKAGLIVGAGAGVAAGASVGLTVFLLGSNPVGWAAGAALVVGAGVDAAAYFLSSDNHPEWASFIMLKEHNAQSLKELNCQEIK